MTITGNRIEPWIEPLQSYFDYQGRSPKGTRVVHNGFVLRAKGRYDMDLAKALISTLNHRKMEGIYA